MPLIYRYLEVVSGVENMTRQDYFPDLNSPSQIKLFLARRNLF